MIASTSNNYRKPDFPVTIFWRWLALNLATMLERVQWLTLLPLPLSWEDRRGPNVVSSAIENIKHSTVVIS